MRNFMLCLKSKKVNFEDCLYLFLKNKTKQKSPKYIEMMEKEKEWCFFLSCKCSMFWNVDTTKAVIALGVSKLKFMLNYIDWKRMKISYFSIAVQFIVWSGFLTPCLMKKNAWGGRDSRFHQRLFLFNKSNLLMIWGLICSFGSSHKWDLL